ncbi:MULTISPECIES: hypothetical protein [Sphingomonas]|uniref:hypothetical protein n=1 Tax=Sphingomonas TaxID=13687 RepID=UPI000DEFDE00|nr:MULTISPECIES: hypothetical protein [Sphingomonas]
MIRLFVFLGSILLAAISITTAGFAADLGELRFTLEARPGAKAQVGFDLDERDGRDHNRWRTNSTMPIRDLNGLAPGDLLGGGSRPLRFAMVRDAGRADCAGTGGDGRGAGRCTVTPERGFESLLAEAGIPRPDRREAFGMLLVDVRRDLVVAVRDAGYRKPSISDLTGLAALGVTPAYIRDLDRRGYKPDHLSDLTAFKALGVTPEYVDGLVRAGFGRLAANDIVQLKALGVSPDYLAQLRAAGYAPFRSSEVVQMRALGITPADFARFRADYGRVDVDRLVQAKALGFVDRRR